VGLDLDLAGVEADECMGDGAREHCPTLRGGRTRVCADSMPRERLLA
jgi:hypothetical protein